MEATRSNDKVVKSRFPIFFVSVIRQFRCRCSPLRRSGGHLARMWQGVCAPVCSLGWRLCTCCPLETSGYMLPRFPNPRALWLRCAHPALLDVAFKPKMGLFTRLFISPYQNHLLSLSHPVSKIMANEILAAENGLSRRMGSMALVRWECYWREKITLGLLLTGEEFALVPYIALLKRDLAPCLCVLSLCHFYWGLLLIKPLVTTPQMSQRIRRQTS